MNFPPKNVQIHKECTVHAWKIDYKILESNLGDTAGLSQYLFISQLDFWLHPVSSELPVDIHVPYASLSTVKDYLNENNIPFSVMINNLQVSPIFMFINFALVSMTELVQYCCILSGNAR